MILKKLNGEQFKELVRYGAKNLRANYQEVDELNVFPVPDGDTGTNMSRTIEGGVHAIENLEENSIGKLGKDLSKGMLMSARGNSGVILSQIFRGICKGLADKDEVNAVELGEAYKTGVKQAYGAVVTPVEGTILTVFREATEAACKAVDEKSTINEFFEAHLKQAAITLKKTKDLLPVLKEANVIDSGGCGYVYIVKGIVKYLDGEKIEAELAKPEESKEGAPVDFSAFSSDDVLQFGYCTEFIMRLQKSKVDVESFDVQKVIDDLNEDDIKGDSIVALKDDDVVKVHVHTKEPGIVLHKMRKYGEFLTIKIENMALQHNETMSEEEAESKKLKEHKKYAVVAVAQGEGVCNQFKEFGVDVIVSGNQTMNPSTEDFIKAFKSLDAENIIVFPNNKNIVMAAEQAAKLYKGANVVVIRCVSIPQCFSALTMLDFTSDDLTIIVGNFNEAIRHVVSAEITTAIRSTKVQGVVIRKGDHIGIVDGKMTISSPFKNRIVADLLRKIPNIKDKEVVTLIYGDGITEEEKVKNMEAVQRAFPYLEVGAIDGGQAVYKYLIAID
jgi:DAK2 domain fusion protein YloV